MLDRQSQGPQCTGCGSPMTLSATEPSSLGQDLRTLACPHCRRVQAHVIESTVTEAWLDLRLANKPLPEDRPLGTSYSLLVRANAPEFPMMLLERPPCRIAAWRSADRTTTKALYLDACAWSTTTDIFDRQ
jgi:hypothetical protein